MPYIVATCKGCESTRQAQVTVEELDLWMSADRPNVQDVFPNLTDEQRELFFLSGYCDKCWREIWNANDAEE